VVRTRSSPCIKPSISQTFEVGYKGLVGDRFLFAADAWRSTETDFTSPLVVRTPLYLLNPQQFAAFLAQNAAPQIVGALMQAGLPQAVAQQQAQALISNWVQIPGGVASSNDVAAGGADLLATYVNFGEIDLWGFDVSAQWLITAKPASTGDLNF